MLAAPEGRQVISARRPYREAQVFTDNPVQQPRAILADEPIASLDPERSREIMDLLRALSQKNGQTLVTSLHAIDFAQSHFDRIVGLREGRILFDTPAAGLVPTMIERLYKIVN